MNFRVLDEPDAKLYQEIRLSALKINPEAFGSTYEREEKFSLETVVERMKPTRDKFVLGAFDDSGSLVGIVAFVRENGLKTAHKGNVFGMYIAPEFRGRGIGKSLILELISKARDCDGLEQINLTVMSKNEIAKKLYISLGFEVFGVEHNALKYNGHYFDEDFMVLKI
jgi:RimJ/RimL family protein N-acetyltransferase